MKRETKDKITLGLLIGIALLNLIDLALKLF
jgi:hypothetical protein|nr:MAG TPA: hypothetical protein [Caudoviricetes sp.]